MGFNQYYGNCKSQDKKIEYLEGTMIDITELINTQEKLMSSEENIKRMLDESPYGIIIQDKGKYQKKLYLKEESNSLLE